MIKQSVEENRNHFKDKYKFIENAVNFGLASAQSFEILESILEIVSKVITANTYLLFLYYSDTDSFELASTYYLKRLDTSEEEILLGEYVCNWVNKNQKPFISNDIIHDNRIEKTEILHSNQNSINVIATPLILSDKILGVIEIFNFSTNKKFSSRDLNLLNRYSNNIAVLVKNELLFNNCCFQLYQRTTLLDIAQEVNGSKELLSLLNFLVATAAQLLNAEASALLLREEDLLRFEIVYGGKGTEIKKITIPIGSGLVGTVAILGESIIINKFSGEGPYIVREINKKTGFITRNLIAAPLRINEYVIGVAVVANRRTVHGFNDDDLSLLEGFANVAAIAIERAQLTERRIEAERLAVIGRTVAGLAHCIKNITNALKGGEYIVDKGLRIGDIELVKTGWEIIKEGGARTRELMLDLLTISKKRELEFTTCNPNQIVTEVVKIFKEEVHKKKVKIDTRYQEDIGFVRIDRKNIFRCLMNLVSNALDATSENKGLIIVEVFSIPEKHFFGFRVTDNGHGITENDQKKLFQEFFSTKGSQGTGLGLSVTHAIVTEHGGNITCESTLEVGATFTMVLPVGM